MSERISPGLYMVESVVSGPSFTHLHLLGGDVLELPNRHINCGLIKQLEGRDIRIAYGQSDDIRLHYDGTRIYPVRKTNQRQSVFGFEED